MSGTSADGINVALVRFQTRRGASGKPALIGHAEYPYAVNIRRAVLAAMNAQSASVADLSRLNFLLGELYADAVLATQKRFRVKLIWLAVMARRFITREKARRILDEGLR